MSKITELINTQDLTVIESSQKKDEKQSSIGQILVLETDLLRTPKIKPIKSQKKELRKLARRKRRLLEVEVRKRAKKSLHRNFKNFQDYNFLLRFLPAKSYHL